VRKVQQRRAGSGFRKRHRSECNDHAGQSDLLSTIGVLKPFYMLIKQQQGPNDGLVSVQGAKWRKRDHKAIWNHTDHLNELGHWDFDQVTSRESQGDLLSRIQNNYLGIAQTLP
jgi:hypothetical protein